MASDSGEYENLKPRQNLRLFFRKRRISGKCFWLNCALHAQTCCREKSACYGYRQERERLRETERQNRFVAYFLLSPAEIPGAGESLNSGVRAPPRSRCQEGATGRRQGGRLTGQVLGGSRERSSDREASGRFLTSSLDPLNSEQRSKAGARHPRAERRIRPCVVASGAEGLDTHAKDVTARSVCRHRLCSEHLASA